VIHLIYSTKKRTPSVSPEVRSAFFAYQTAILQEWSTPALLIGGVADHVHMFVRD
jgi:hypothetical protein